MLQAQGCRRAGSCTDRSLWSCVCCCWFYEDFLTFAKQPLSLAFPTVSLTKTLRKRIGTPRSKHSFSSRNTKPCCLISTGFLTPQCWFSKCFFVFRSIVLVFQLYCLFPVDILIKAKRASEAKLSQTYAESSQSIQYELSHHLCVFVCVKAFAPKNDLIHRESIPSVSFGSCKALKSGLPQSSFLKKRP